MARIVLPGGEERPLEGDTVTLGRDSANDLAFLGDPKISRWDCVAFVMLSGLPPRPKNKPPGGSA